MNDHDGTPDERRTALDYLAQALGRRIEDLLATTPIGFVLFLAHEDSTVKPCVVSNIDRAPDAAVPLLEELIRVIKRDGVRSI